jgi:hypothetical protein
VLRKRPQRSARNLPHRQENRGFVVAQAIYLALAIGFAVAAHATYGLTHTVLLVPAWLFGIISAWSLLFVGAILVPIGLALVSTRYPILAPRHPEVG